MISENNKKEDSHRCMARKILRNEFSRTSIFSLSVVLVTLSIMGGYLYFIFVFLLFFFLFLNDSFRFMWIFSKGFALAFCASHFFMVVGMAFYVFLGYGGALVLVLISLIFYNILLADKWRELQNEFGVGQNDLFKND